MIVSNYPKILLQEKELFHLIRTTNLVSSMASALLSLDVDIPRADRDDKKRRKKKKKSSEKDLEDDVVMRRGVIYVGRLPHGFYESQLKDYFSQFGRVTKVHVSRNKKVRANMHYKMDTIISSLHYTSIFGMILSWSDDLVNKGCRLHGTLLLQCTLW